MPLVTKLLPSREMVEEGQESSLHAQEPQEVAEKDRDSGYEDFHEFEEGECVDSDMEGSILHRPRPKKPVRAPTLPQRSEKRTSKILENVMLELQTLEKATKEQEKVSIVEQSDPHEHYLSSEEDGSLSDDYEDYLSDLDGTNSEDAMDTRAESSRASSRKSQEITAVAISFMVVGKPQIIEITVSQHNSPQSARNRLSMNLDALSNFNKFSEPPKRSLLRRPAPLNLRDSAVRDSRRMSISSMTSSHSSNIANSLQHSTSTTPSNVSLPTARKTSRLANLTTLVTQTKNSLSGASHSFLNSDPFASPTPEASPQNNDTEPPKTPTSMAATAFKRGLQRTLSRARKTSMPKISLAYTAGVVPQRIDSHVSIPTPQDAKNEVNSVHSAEDKVIEQNIEMVKRHESMPITPSPRGGPVHYEEVMKSAIRKPPPPPPVPASPSKERKTSLMMGLGRRKSIKAR